MADHLMMCGNKTDQCPNCRKYIRRAVSAYHYENNCANPDESTTDDNTHPMAQHSGKVLRLSFINLELSCRKAMDDRHM